MADCNNAAALDREIIACRKCPRLAAYLEQVAAVKRRAYLDWEYWARPVPSFGPVNARLLILGLAPGAHGANRTGRVFTGDRSGDFLYRALYQTGFASQPDSTSVDDGLVLRDARISSSVRCAPPDNKPLPVEIRTCRGWLVRELGLMPQLEVVVALGGLAFSNYLTVLKEAAKIASAATFAFGHDRQFETGARQPVLIGSYHPSQQNTSTGRLTEAMLQAVFERARRLLR